VKNIKNSVPAAVFLVTTALEPTAQQYSNETTTSVTKLSH